MTATDEGVRLVTKIVLLARDMNDDELSVLALVAEGLSGGRDVYGPLNIDGDSRDWVVEALQEMRDLNVYIGSAALRLSRLHKVLNGPSDD